VVEVGSLHELARELLARPEAAAGQLARVRDEVAQVLLAARGQLEAAFALAEQEDDQLMAALDELISRWQSAQTFEGLQACLPAVERLEERVDAVLAVAAQDFVEGEAAAVPIVDALEAALEAVVEHCRLGGRAPLQTAMQELEKAERALSRMLDW